MATRSFIADEKTAAGVGAISAAGGILRYQLNVVAGTTEDVVRSAGGWLFDRARAGWDVNVMVVKGGAPRPLCDSRRHRIRFRRAFPVDSPQRVTDWGIGGERRSSGHRYADP